MTLKEMKEKVLRLIEEINPDSEVLTDDPDIEAKINDVINQVMFEVARMKKLPDFVEFAVLKDEVVRFADITEVTGNEVYQLDVVRGVPYELKANGTIIKALESGIAEIDYFKYPVRITKETEDAYEFELPADALEIMPYGIAGDLLKSDVSAEYGQIYSNRYESMLQRLDPRYSMGMFTIEGGVNI